MQNHHPTTEPTPATIMQPSCIGLAEIDSNGEIIHLNPKGRALLRPIWMASGLQENNFYAVLEQIAPQVSKKIKESRDEAGYILTNESHRFPFITGNLTVERHFSFTAIKMFTHTIAVGFEDIAEKYSKDEILQQAILDKAVVQGKFEIASNVLHDIGNAVVGFSSYLTRIRQGLEQDNAENLQNLVSFFETHHSVMATALGNSKADAVVKILGGIEQTQKSNYADICKSIKEQQNIIVHIQDILNIQRQYMNGSRTDERKPIYLDGIINDCMSMVFASLNKRNITIFRDIPGGLPVINGDRTRLMQVILNILKNSIEAIDVYAAEKSISVSIANPANLLVLQIRDSGKGFDEATGKRLFTRGFTTKSSGTGLGLNSCRAIIEDCDGKINITSDGPEKGALTTITFKT